MKSKDLASSGSTFSVRTLIAVFVTLIVSSRLLGFVTRAGDEVRSDVRGQVQPGVGQRQPQKVEGPAQPRVLQQNALDLIEGERGGRHWIDAKTDPPKSAEESLKCFRIEDGVRIELVAAEPLVRDPVAIEFDQRGRLFVVEYGDYPVGPVAGGEPLSRVVYLEDSDGDGRSDKRHVFADKLKFAHSLMAYNEGLLVGAQTQILFLKDTNGDNIADVREVLYDGFEPAHPQMQIGNPRWGLDNWVYLNYGPGKITSSKLPGRTLEMPRKEVRFNPLTFEFEADSGVGQFGNTIDRWGHRFYSSNRNPIITTLLPPELLGRNKFYSPTQGSYDVGKSGGDTRVYPLVEMKSNYLSHAGTHTSACGVTAYFGDKLPAAFDDSVFVCEPIGHLVTRSLVKPHGLRLQAERTQPEADFLASTDTWFRPASLANGPDGALYLADMYRLWVEHPKFLPPEIAERIDWRAGEDRGRIYRITTNQTRTAFAEPRSTEETVKLLGSTNGWQRFLGQRLLIEKQNKAAAPLVREVSKSPNATSRLHALWTLDGLGELTVDDVASATNDVDPHVRRDAVKLAAKWLGKDDSVMEHLARRLPDPDVRVRFELAIALAGTSGDVPDTLLASLAISDGRDEWFADGLLTSVETRAGLLLEGLIDSIKIQADSPIKPKPDATSFPSNHAYLVKRLASIVGTRGDIDELQKLIGKVTSPGADDDNANANAVWWKAAIISGLGEGLPRHRGGLGQISLPKLLSDPPGQLAKSAAGLRELLEQNQVAALDKLRPVADRVAAVELLAYQPFAKAAPAFDQLLANGQPVELQLAGINGLAANGSPETAEMVLARWSELGPSVRGPALAVLLRRVPSTRQMLEAMSEGTMQTSALSIDQRVQLLKHTDQAIREKSTELFGGAVSTNRREVVQQYQAALDLKASSPAGHKVFQKICSKCHRLDGEGFEAGPDLSDVRNRSPLALLYEVLDPNAKVEPRFTSYTVVTNDGKIFSGLIVSETPEAVVVRMAEGKQQVIGRGEIEVIRAGNVSLMPEGIEKDVTVQDMADLLEFLKMRKR